MQLKMSSKTEESTSTKRQTSDETASGGAKKAKKEEIVDLADTLGLKPGNRIQVLWDVTKDGESEPKSHWWGATLLEHDGRSHEGVAIRVLEYDVFEECGYSSKSREDVIFFGRDLILGHPDQQELEFRSLTADDTEVLVAIEDIEATVDNILASALNKVSAGFSSLPRSQQATIAEKVSQRKEKLLSLIHSHLEKSTVLTGSDMRELMAQTVSST